MLIFFSLFSIQDKSIEYSVPIPGGDAHQYFNTAYNLAQYNVHDYDRNENPKPSFYREPLYPFLLSLNYRLIGLNSEDRLNCLFEDKKKCSKYILSGKYLNFIYLILILISAYIFLREFNINKPIILLSLLIIVNNPLITQYVNEFLTEVLASLLFIISAFSIYKIFLYKNLSLNKIILYGFLFSLLIMTKFVYFFSIYICLILIISVIAINFILKKNNKKSKLYIALNYRQIMIFLIIALIIPTLWKVRNFNELGFFELSPRGYSGAIMQRLEYLTMNENEKKAGHWLYFFKSGMKDKAMMNIKKKDLERYELSCSNIENWYCKAFTDDGLVLKRIDPMNRKVFYKIKDESIKVLIENLPKHLYLTPLFLQRGTLNVINGLGDYKDFKTSFYRYFTFINFIIMFIGILYGIFRLNYLIIALSLPLVYHYGVYSMLTHFEPRYSILTLNYIFIFNIILIKTIYMGNKWNLIKKK